jgi:hypothetical protein
VLLSQATGRTVHVVRRAIQFYALWADTSKSFILCTNMAAFGADVPTIDVAHHYFKIAVFYAEWASDRISGGHSTREINRVTGRAQQ